MDRRSAAGRNVLLVSNRFELDPGAGGTEVLTADLATALSRRGMSVTWLATGEVGTPSKVDTFQRIQVAVPSETSPSVSWRAREAVIARIVGEALDGVEPFDVVHITHFSRLGLAFLDTRPLLRAKAVATLTDYTAVCGDYQLVHRPTGCPCAPPVAAENCSACLSWGSDERTDAVEYDDWRTRNLRSFNERFDALWVQTPHQRLRLADAGLDPDKVVSDRAQYAIPASWRRDPSGDGIPTLLFLGRASPEKGLLLLLEAFTGWPGSARLRVVTTADDEAYERAARDVAARDDRVEWLDPVGRDDLAGLLNTAAALVVPSQWDENHPMVMHYAMALGVPVLCSAVPSLAHLAGVADVRAVERYDEPASWTRAFEELRRDAGPRADRTAEFRQAYDDFVDTITASYSEGVHAVQHG